MQKIFIATFKSITEIKHEIHIFDTNSNNPNENINVILESPGYTLTNNANISEYVKGGIIESSVTFTIINKNRILDDFLKALRESADGRFIIEIIRDGASFWKGILLSDFSNRPDYPQEGIEFTATDGFLILDKILANTSNVQSLGLSSLSLLKTIIVGLRQIPTIPLFATNFILVATEWFSQTMIDYPQQGVEVQDDPMDRVIFSGSTMWQKVTKLNGYNGEIVKKIEPLTYREVIQHILERFNAILMMNDGVWTIIQRHLLKDGLIEFKAYRSNYILPTDPHIWRGNPFLVSKDFVNITKHNTNQAKKYRSDGFFSYLPALNSVTTTYGGGNLSDGFPSLIPAGFTVGQHYHTIPVSSGPGNFLHIRLKFTENFVIDWNGETMPQTVWSQFVKYKVHVKQGDKFLMEDGTWKNQVGGRCYANDNIKIYCTDIEEWTFARKDWVEIDKEWISDELPYADTGLEIWLERIISNQTSQDVWIMANSNFNFQADLENHYVLYIVDNQTPVNYATFKAENPNEQRHTTDIELTPSLFGSARILNGSTLTILNNNLFTHAGLWGVGESGDKDKYFNQILAQETLKQQQTNLMIFSGSIYDRDLIKKMNPLQLVDISIQKEYTIEHYALTPNRVIYNALHEQWEGDWIEISSKEIQPTIPPIVIDPFKPRKPINSSILLEQISKIVDPETGTVDTTGHGLYDGELISNDVILQGKENANSRPLQNGSVRLEIVNGVMQTQDSLGNVKKLGDEALTILQDDNTEVRINHGFIYNLLVASNPLLCNSGWSVPSDMDYVDLIEYLISIGCNYDDTSTGNKVSKAMSSVYSDGFWEDSDAEGVPGNNDYPTKQNMTNLNIKGSGVRSTEGFKGFKEVCFLLTSGGQHILSIGFDFSFSIFNADYSGSIRIQRQATLEELKLRDFTIVPNAYTGNDGKIYNAVKIGDKLWSTENLAETKYNDNSPILYCTSQEKWREMTNGYYCAYNNDLRLAYTSQIKQLKDDVQLKDTSIISTFKEINETFTGFEYTITKEDSIILIAKEIDLFLPDATQVKGQKFTILTDDLVNNINIQTSLKQGINNIGNNIDLQAYQSLTIVSTGTSWRILSLI